ncbi:sensor domain-containing protein [Streptomyces sp. NBC_00083]|uniref:sensor domain-containing protein n=1 Tax=Streptomyces sp. NBC_00083 TaxID=2975647 RepID=UPI0022542CC5|nr:sensor domain-containing protein [Streptomyces sp. NBC_00083]MCX5382616.1 sensor domain-containing protein [Streptomyces sp. NBC_00083]
MDLAQRNSAPTPTAPTPTASTSTAATAATLVDAPGSDQHARHRRRAGDGGRRGFPGGWKAFLREPFRAATWLRFAYLLLALPVGIVCLPIALVGGPAGRIQRGLARRLLGVEVADPDRGGRTGLLALAHAVISLPLNLIALTVSGYFWTVVLMNLAYPLRPGGDPTDAWGGPTMAGAWAVHGIGGGVSFLLITPWVMKGFTVIQARLVKGFLGADRTGLLKATWVALALALVCAILSIPVIHQL